MHRLTSVYDSQMDLVGTRESPEYPEKYHKCEIACNYIGKFWKIVYSCGFVMPARFLTIFSTTSSFSVIDCKKLRFLSLGLLHCRDT